MAWPLSVFRQRRTEKYCGGIYFGRKDCGMIGIRGLNWKRLVGLDNLREEYAFARDDSTGYTSAKKIPDQWVHTTCGYCSVGCGIEIGVKEGRAVASRPHAIASRQSRQAVPQGPIRTLHDRSRESRTISTAAQERQARTRRLGRSADDDGRAFPRYAENLRAAIVRRAEHRPIGHGRILHARQAGAAWLRHQQLRRQYDALYGKRRFRLQDFVRQRRASRRL